mgnify:CR=1 FL=1
MPQQSKFVCPKCSSNDTVETIDTVPGAFGSWMRRRRHCTRCQCVFGTSETVTEIIDEGIPEREWDKPLCSCCDRQMRLFVVAGTEGE